MTLTVCESVAAITLHLRIVTAEHPISLSGHALPRPHALCGTVIAWDTRSPISAARCGACRIAAMEMPTKEG